MAMHKADELVEVTLLLRKEMGHLGIEELETSSIYIHNETIGKTECWFSIQDRNDENKLISDHMILDLNDTWVGRQMQEFYHSKDLATSIVMKGEERIEWITYCAEKSDLFSAGGFYGETIPERTYHLYKFNNGFMGAAAPGDISAESWDLLKRATAVFSHAYTRFSDLKNAEAQAREAQIQLGLERVRARAMAMHKSEQLAETAKVLFEQFDLLGKIPDRMSIGIVNEETGNFELWVTDQKGETTDHAFLFRLDETTSVSKIYNAWKKKKDAVVVDLTGQELKDWLQFLKKEVKLPINAAKIKGRRVHQAAFFSHGFLLLTSHQPVAEEIMKLLVRFAGVFDLTYTRFLDLKKAETQAREAQIEAALERVRSRSIAMRKSEELADLSFELVKQIHALGIDTWFCAFNIYDDHPEGSLEWGSNTQGTYEAYRTPREGIFLKYYEAGQKGDTLLVNEIGENECPAHYDYLCSLPGVGEQLLAMKDAGIPFPESQIDHVAFFKYGYIIFITFEQAPDAHNIFKRFAKAFEQTYTRFLDLKKAEAQAREAQIEASLEKVRGVALSLQKSDEMLQVAQVLYEQLLELGFNNIRNAIIDIKNGDTDTFTDYDYSHEMSGTITQMSYHDDPTLEGQFKKMATTTNDFFELILEGKELEDLKKMRINNGEAPDPRLDKIDVLTYNLYSFGNGAIGISNFGVLTEEEKSVLARFNNVFTFAYKRYNDMLQAELQAREALIELSLERIRAQVTAMQESSELLDIVVTMQTEFNKLGHEAHYFWHMRWLPDKYEKALTNTEGDRIGNVLELPRGFHGLKNMMDWEESDEPSAVFALDPNTAADYIDKMIKLGRFQEIDHTAPGPDEVRDMGGLTFVMARTTHGEIGYTLPGVVPYPPEEDIAILVRFAGVFDLAYRRFEDLKVPKDKIGKRKLNLPWRGFVLKQWPCTIARIWQLRLLHFLKKF
ncbi:MAG: hypothetical protein R2750_07425 [Bacteroidales bacterium]